MIWARRTFIEGEEGETVTLFLGLSGTLKPDGYMMMIAANRRPGGEPGDHLLDVFIRLPKGHLREFPGFVPAPTAEIPGRATLLVGSATEFAKRFRPEGEE